jgi:hypothetical protein
MATIAVFLALGGVATAAFTLPKKSVGAKNLKKDAVTNPKVADAAIGNAELGNAAVDAAKVADRSIGLAKTAVLDTTVTQDFGSITGGSCQSIAKTVPATIQPTDFVVALPDPTNGSADGRWYEGILFLSAGPAGDAPSNKVELHACANAGASGDPANTTFRVLVFR